MDETQFLLRMIAGLALVTAVAAVALAVSTLKMLKSVSKLDERAQEFFDSCEPLLAQARTAITDFTEQSGELLPRLNALSALLHKQALQADSVINNLATTAERNIGDVEATLKSTLDRLNAVAETLDRAVKAPIAQVRALAAGIVAAIRQFSQGRPPSPERISTDEEMFI